MKYSPDSLIPPKSLPDTSIIAKYQEFIKQAILLDQTSIVKSQLAASPQFLASIQNLQEFQVMLSEGLITGTYPVIAHHIEKCEKEIKSLTLRLSNASDPELLEKVTLLACDKAHLKAAKGKDREVYQWLLVSPLLADKLTVMGEIVLYLPGSYFWGICNSHYSFSTIDTTLLEIFEELTLSISK